jgi:8-oxo-dGTP pyrophosphatase MutT (NUDIX family)
MDPTRRLPDSLAAHARAFADEAHEPVEPRDASTVVLARPGDGAPGGLEVYLLRRHVDMAFAAGMCVFPGGGVDKRDFDAEIGWVGPTPAEWAALLGTDEAFARALVCAAVRETFEESGVLLAGPTEESVVEDTTGDDWEADRVALESRELSMTEFLFRRGLVLRTDLLGVWGGWLTPVFEPRRYRTWFFVALLPAGQRTRDVSSESSSVTWLPALAAPDQVDAGELLMLPPTYLTCLEVGQYADPAAVLEAAHGRTVEMFTPAVEPLDEGHTLSLPDELRPLLAARRG